MFYSKKFLKAGLLKQSIRLKIILISLLFFSGNEAIAQTVLPLKGDQFAIMDQVIDSLQVTSPDKKIQFAFILEKGKPLYQVSYGKKSVVLPSSLGLKSNPNGGSSAEWAANLLVAGTSKRSITGSWLSNWSERHEIPDIFNELTVTLVSAGSRKGSIKLIARAYNEGVAFRYFFPEDKNTQILEIGEELTGFNFPLNTQAFYTDKAQGKYEKRDIDQWVKAAEMPLTLALPNGLWASVTQAEMINYSRVRLKTNGLGKLVTQLYSPVVETSPYFTPWRLILIGGKPGELLQNNYLVQNLNPPNKLKNTEWIKPGKVMRSGLSTGSAKKIVDFAVEQNIDYVHLDAGWYGHEYEVASDATAVDVDPGASSRGALDIQEIVKYAHSKGKGVLLYINHRALERQLDSILPLYKNWGVAGVKFGFVHTGSQLWNRWLHEAIKKAADHQLMVDVHDEYYPTGFSRTYPNLLTQEGVLGNEGFPDATHNTILPFTRYIAGAGDYTPCFNHAKLQTTKCHQLALPIVYFSPWQYLFWYGNPSQYQHREEIEFWKNMPTVWDETRVDGLPGEYATVIRRKGKNWFQKHH